MIERAGLLYVPESVDFFDLFALVPMKKTSSQLRLASVGEVCSLEPMKVQLVDDGFAVRCGREGRQGCVERIEPF
ncbi:hypothetical protein RBSWK_00875 [Rhodopirellula baltica SWK14]|uniref:Uncharacterized protein n=1 Tax=Rhodopirellula baltica SWK14 TaxID=993516 RepID=L7CNI8_RHOBT|nr:hypothetical protein RBSWK_00875 [Rhodopirellula baltica SWK14]